MGNASDVVAAAGSSAFPASAARVLDAFRTRIGDDRFAVWFGDAACTVEAAADRDAVQVVLAAGSGFTHEWLRRTFRGDFEAAVQQICGAGTETHWRSQAVAVPVEPAGAPEADAGHEHGLPEGRREPPAQRASGGRRAREVAVTPAPAAVSRQLRVVSRPGASSVAPSRRQPLRLSDFVVGPSNRMAFAGVELAAARPGEMSPLVIHGPSGVGKTHLLEAACDRARELHPGITAVVLSAEQFTTAFLQSLHGGGLPGFRRTCRTADVLVIDDLQFFVGKKATLLELQQTLDAVLRQGRQVIFACDRELDALPDLGADLLTRLRGGMMARLLPPDYDVRRGIVAAVCDKRGLGVPDDVLHYVATSMTRHARELLGAINRLEATSHMLGLPVTLEMAQEALADLIRSSGRSVRLADIERAVCKAFGIESGALQSARRARSASHPRMLAMFLARKHTQAALTEIGGYFGRRSHSTVIAAQKAVGDWVAKGSQVVLADATWDVEEAIRRVEDVLRAG
jgi:chromosomal replication initiator protein